MLFYCHVTALVLLGHLYVMPRYCSFIAILFLLDTALFLLLYVTSLLLLCCWSVTALFLLYKRIAHILKYHNVKYHIFELRRMI